MLYSRFGLFSLRESSHFYTNQKLNVCPYAIYPRPLELIDARFPQQHKGPSCILLHQRMTLEIPRGFKRIIVASRIFKTTANATNYGIFMRGI